jgi:hypothetical protein
VLIIGLPVRPQRLHDMGRSLGHMREFKLDQRRHSL